MTNIIWQIKYGKDIDNILPPYCTVFFILFMKFTSPYCLMYYTVVSEEPAPSLPTVQGLLNNISEEYVNISSLS
jgi:hypothetical protein